MKKTQFNIEIFFQMKKLILTTLFILVLPGGAFSKTFEFSKCHSNKSPLKAIYDYKNWNDYSRGENIKDNIYSINPSKETVTNLLIFDDLDKELKERQGLWSIQNAYNNANLYPSSLRKTYKLIYTITDFTNVYLTAKRYAYNLITGKIDDNSIVEINIDLENLTIEEKRISKGQHWDTRFIVCEHMSAPTDDSENSGFSGTAFFVSNRGHLLTNNHVVEGCSISKITYKNNDYDTKLIATDKTLDLALLKAELRPKSFFNFSKENVKKLNKVYVAGYPLGKGLSDDLKITSGIVSSLKGYDDNSNEIQIDAPINPGNSGGPIINENGDLVAIAVSGLAKDQTEGINFGIKSSAAELFLKSNRVTPKKSMYGGLKDNDKLLEILEEATVYTYCN
jgi:S1-C subfamily serine protease